MSSQKSILMVNDYGIYPELSKALQAGQYKLSTEHLMRKAIKLLKKTPPDLLILEFFHEPQFRDRVSNIESILAQIQRNQGKTKTLVLFYPGHESWLQQLQKIYYIDACLINDINLSDLLSKIDTLLCN